MRPMKLPEGNQSPVLTSIAVASATLVLIVGGGFGIRASPEAVADFATPVLMAGVVLGAWASHAATPWSRVGYLWRFGVAIAVVVVLGALCGVPPFDRPPA
jgi:hypothetical protein